MPFETRMAPKRTLTKELPVNIRLFWQIENRPIKTEKYDVKRKEG